MKRLSIIIIGIFIFYFLTLATANAILTGVTEDAFVDSRYPDKTSPYNYPNGMYLWSGQQTSGDIHAYAWMKFDVGENFIWQNSELSLYCNHSSGSYATTTKIWWVDDDSWDDDSITYNNMPDFWTNNTVLNEQYISSTGWYSFDTSGLFGLETGNTVSFVIGSLLPAEKVGGNYWKDFENLEYKGGNSAYLEVTNPIPEPATMLLLGSGLIGLAGFRRKINK